MKTLTACTISVAAQTTSTGTEIVADEPDDGSLTVDERNEVYSSDEDEVLPFGRDDQASIDWLNEQLRAGAAVDLYVAEKQNRHEGFAGTIVAQRGRGSTPL